ncbi:MAG: YggT family protein [Spirochaetes bacterium]|nr:YggT family protein [Spirochaetota bacterium]
MVVLGKFLAALISLLILALTVRIILSWLSLPHSRWLSTFYRYTDPVLDYFRKHFPIRFGIFDASILIPIIILMVSLRLVNELMIMQRPITPFYPIILFVDIASMALDYFLFICVICVAILLLFNIMSPNTYHPLMTTLRSIFDPWVMRLRRIIPIRHKHADRIYLGLFIVIILLLMMVKNFIFYIFLNSLAGLEANYIESIRQSKF